MRSEEWWTIVVVLGCWVWWGWHHWCTPHLDPHPDPLLREGLKKLKPVKLKTVTRGINDIGGAVTGAATGTVAQVTQVATDTTAQVAQTATDTTRQVTQVAQPVVQTTTKTAEQLAREAEEAARQAAAEAQRIADQTRFDQAIAELARSLARMFDIFRRVDEEIRS